VGGPEAVLTVDTDAFLELHGKICDRPFLSKSHAILAEVEEAVSKCLFLSVDHVVRGGSVGKGTAIFGQADAELVFFLRGLPPSPEGMWLPGLVRAVGGVLSQQLDGDDLFEEVEVAADGVRLCARGLESVFLRFSPVFNSHAEAVQSLASVPVAARRRGAAALAEERVQFIARQPGLVKGTIRLIKWWRDGQIWSGPSSKPPDAVIELASIYSAAQSGPKDQRAAVSAVLALLSHLSDVRVVWSNYYSRGDIAPDVLRQRPLLMDPVDPAVNVADPEAFDASELMAAAGSTRFFS